MTVAEIIVLTASYYRVALSEPVLAMYCEDLEDLDPETVIQAYRAFRRDAKNKTMPLPAQIRELIEPSMTPDAEAREILGRIKESIGLFGYPQGEAAREYIGEVGWRIVREHGGWTRVCESNFLHNQGMQANARDRLINLVQFKKELGDLNQLQEPSRRMLEETGLEKIGDRIKKLFETDAS